MKNVIILLFLAFCLHGYGQIINFPDANFKNALVNTKCVDTNGDNIGDSDADLNNDGEVDLTEGLNIKSLIINNLQISSIAGIDSFTNLKNLNCRSNKISSISFSSSNQLKQLDCGYNLLTNFDFQNFSSLEKLSCNNNQLISINLNGAVNLKLLNCEYNKLSSLDAEGLNNLETLICNLNKINNLNVKGLINLQFLTCIENDLSFLNITDLVNLKYFKCNTNKLTTLLVNGLEYLEHLDCSNNQLTSLNVQGLINLSFLLCISNQLTQLDLKGLEKLSTFHCAFNQLKHIDLSELTWLYDLYISNNKLTTLNVKGLSKLTNLSCSQNFMVSLDLEGMSSLRSIHCIENQLKFLNIKGISYFLNHIDFSKNQNLKYICCNDYEIIKYKAQSISNNQNCEVNSYCSFTPGGKFYILKGENKYDLDDNGCDEPDIKLPNFKFNITDGSTSGSLITNTIGNYNIPVQEGTHTITPILAYPDHFEVTPPSFTVTFPSISDTITQDFCITPKGTFRQTNITVIPLSPPARPGFDASYKIVWENVGNQIESGTLNFTYDETLLDYISATQSPDQIADGIVKWNFSNLLPFEKREITVTLKVNRPTDTPAVNAGDKLYLTASILDNIFTLENTVVGSYDPNDKTCLQGDRVEPDMVGKYVDYLVRFENTGNYAAENVVIKDIIDTKTFDVSSLQITDASHEVYTRIEGNKVEFIFENIQLPFDDANNDGYIALKIKTLPTLVLGDSLKNLADIYFDYNFPIRTNEAQTTIALPSFTQDFNTEVNVYPNPVRDNLYLESNQNWSKAEIFDISGRIMRSVTLVGQSLDVSGLESGTYLVRLKDGEKIGMFKFVKI